MNQGKLIVIYGVNNIGKTTQAKKIADWLNSKGKKAEYLKYPVYNSPTGERINGILREGKEKNISETQLQTIFYYNRKEFEPVLKEKLRMGTTVIAEDYIGTSLAWGSAKGADDSYLKKLNSDLIKEDLCILMDGKRFLKGKEENHIHEENNELIEKVRNKFLKLAKENKWIKVNANRAIEQVFEDIKKEAERIV